MGSNTKKRTAGVIAVLLGLPLAETAHAQGVGGVVFSIFDLIFSIVDVAGDS